MRGKRVSGRGARGPRAGLLLIGVLALAMPAAGCGDDDETTTEAEPLAAEETTTSQAEAAPTLDAAKVEDALAENLDGVELLGAPATVFPEQGGPGQETEIGGGTLEVKSVTCPEDVTQEKGGEFTCELDGGKQDASVELKQLDDSGSELSFKAKFESPAGPNIPVETEIEAEIKLK